MMEWSIFDRVISALSLVVFLIIAAGWTYSLVRGRPLVGGGGRRLRIIDALNLDTRRRLVVVACDDVEHLLLLGPTQDLVVATNLKVREDGE